MIDSYKNFERLKYRISQDISKIKKIVEINSNMWFEEMITQLSSAIISALACGAITTSQFSYVKNFFNSLLKNISSYMWKSFLSGALTTLVFILIYVLFFIIFRYITSKIRRYRKANSLPDDNPNWQKNFDNIACDSIFVAFEYKKEYETSGDQEQNLRTFYFCETVHYLQTACIYTKNLCLDKKYIYSPSTGKGVEQYRIYNMIELIKELLIFVEKENSKAFSRQEDKKRVENQINSIEEALKSDIIPRMESLMK